MTTTTLNGQFGDFKDGTNAAGTADYVYDANGNVVVDLNKNLQSLNNGAAGTNGVHYNFLDKPDQIRIVGKGTVLIVYSADGEKLQRAFVPDAGGSGTVTTYINQYIFQETATLTTSSPAPFSGTGVHLAYMNFEEGRIRAMTTTSTSNGFDALSENGNLVLPGTNISGAIDYFIMDYQQNVRMILTEETHSATNTCTMETSRASAEDPVFGQTGAGNEVEVTRITTPSGWTNNTTASVSHVGNLSGHYIGPNTLQKVMAGDLVSANVQYYFANATFNNNNPNIIPALLTSLGSAINGSATVGELTHAASSNITSNLNGVTAFANAAEPNSGVGGPPQAYLTILFFDERFNFISAADGGVAQAPVAATWSTSTQPLTLVNIKAPKNGYAYVYVSNRTDQDVFFDNLVVNLVTSNIIEEDHYYAFGLKIAGISSHKLQDVNEGKVSNPYQYNDKEMLDEDAGLNWYDYGFRNYDPQIGRFLQSDPLGEDYSELSVYQFAADDPVGNIDLDGLFSIGALTDGGEVPLMTEVVITAARPTHVISDLSRIISVIGKTSIMVHGAQIASDVINAPITSPAVGSLGPGPETNGEKLNIDKNGFIDSKKINQSIHIQKGERSNPQNFIAIIIHRTAGSASSTINEFKGTKKSVHFLITKDGTIYQLASLKKFTIHIWEGKQKKGFGSLHNYNSIGIEHEGNYDEETKTWEPVTPEMTKASAWLVNSLMMTYDLSQSNIYSHDVIQDKTPGEGTVVQKAIAPYLVDPPVIWHPPMSLDNQNSLHLATFGSFGLIKY
jgi:RHS repeat-associated protein